MATLPFETNVEFSAGELLTLPASGVLDHIQALFKKWGIYHQRLKVQHEGDEYAFTCDDKAFVVYRLLPTDGQPFGSPGWPVCLVTADGVVDECSPPYHDEDFFACHLGLADWLTLIQQFFGES